MLYTSDTEEEKVTVPNLVGYSVSTVNSIASSYGLNVSISGVTASSSAVSVSQSIAAGKKVDEGTVISVEFGGSTVVHD